MLKRAFQLLCIASTSLLANAAEESTLTAIDKEAHLFILSGQSNMVGLNPAISFTPAVTNAFGADSIVVVKDATNSQAIRRWVKGWKSVQGKPATKSGDLYDQLLRKVREATAGRNLKTVTLVWMQGEADAAANQVNVYKASLDQLFDQLRKDLNKKEIHFVLGRLSDYSLGTGKHPEWQQMRDLQVAYAEASPLGDWVDTDDLNNKTNPQTGQPKNDVHYTRQGYKQFGARLAEKAINLISPREFPGEKNDFHGYDSYHFRIDNNRVDVKMICPTKPAAGKPWLWRSLFWEASPLVYEADLKLVDEGYYVVLVHGNVSGHPKGNAHIDAAYNYLTNEQGFAKTCSMASMSRGTLSLFRWASENPEKVNSIYVDNGVMNIHSWPAGKNVPGTGSKSTGNPKSWVALKNEFGYQTDAEALEAKESPIDLIKPLAKARVPILLVCGDSDHAVPYEENDAIMETRYKALGGQIEVIIEKKGHTHGMKNPTPIIEFIRTHTTAALSNSDAP